MNFGRLLEVGTPSELYQHPQTEFVATFLGTTNLMVGESTVEGVKLGPVSFPMNADSKRIEQASSTQRVQVLFRPEDVTLSLPDEPLDSPQLGVGEIEANTFSGVVERLRVRMPAIPGVRPIAPPVAFGEDAVLIEAARTQDVARRFPLNPGDRVHVGVQRIPRARPSGFELSNPYRRVRGRAGCSRLRRAGCSSCPCQSDDIKLWHGSRCA